MTYVTVEQLAREHAQAHLVDMLAHGDFDNALNADALEAPELLAALRVVWQERAEQHRALDALWAAIQPYDLPLDESVVAAVSAALDDTDALA